MNTYKVFTLFVFTLLTINNFVMAQTCQELKDELFVNHHNYHKASLEKCDGNSRFCCSSSKPGSCKSVYQAQLEYNKALAKVNLLEGLTAISLSVENSHHAIKNLDKNKFVNAEKSIDVLLQNFEKATLIHESLNFVPKKGTNNETTNFWDGYGRDSDRDDIGYTKEFVRSKCENDDTFKSFCEQINKASNDSNIDIDDIYKDLHGFAVADYQVNEDNNLKVENYKKYQQYLMMNDGKSNSPIPLKELLSNEAGKGSSEIKKVLELKKHIQDYQNTPKKETAQKIIKISAELEELDMGFNEGVDLKDGNTFSNFVDNHFTKDLTRIGSLAGVMTGKEDIKKNLKSNKESMDIELKDKEKYLIKKMAPLKGKLGSRCSSVSSYESIGQCLEKICGSEYPRGCQTSGNETLNQLGLGQMVKDFQNYDEGKKLAMANEEMLNCLDKDSVRDIAKYNSMDAPLSKKQHQCMLDVKEKYGDYIKEDLNEARASLKKAKENLEYINKGQPVNDLLAQKLLSIKALAAKKCIGDNNKIKANSMSSICNTLEVDAHSKTALSLTDDIGNVLVSYDFEQYRDFLKANGVFNGKTRSSYSKMVQECQDNPNLSDVCKTIVGYEIKKDQIKKQKEDRIRRRQEAMLNKGGYTSSRYTMYKKASHAPVPEEGPSGFAYAMGGLATGVIQNIPGIFGYMQEKRSHEMQMQYYDNYLQNYQNFYGENATHHTYNIQVDYSDWYRNQNTFNPTNYRYFSPANNVINLNPMPVSWTSGNGDIYMPGVTTGF